MFVCKIIDFTKKNNIKIEIKQSRTQPINYILIYNTPNFS